MPKVKCINRKRDRASYHHNCKYKIALVAWTETIQPHGTDKAVTIRLRQLMFVTNARQIRECVQKQLNYLNKSVPQKCWNYRYEYVMTTPTWEAPRILPLSTYSRVIEDGRIIHNLNTQLKNM